MSPRKNDHSLIIAPHYLKLEHEIKEMNVLIHCDFFFSVKMENYTVHLEKLPAQK